MREAAGEVPGAEVYLTGQSAIESDLEPVQNRDLFVGEVLIAIPIALIILVFVFGTLSFLLPFLLAAVAIPVTLACVWVFANFMTLSTYLTNMVTLIGLGIADRLLAADGLPATARSAAPAARRKTPSRATMETAGRAVVFSGTAVAIGLALMLFMPLPFMRGFGLAGLLIPLVSVLAPSTLLPVLLYWLEDRLDRVRLRPEARDRAARGRRARLLGPARRLDHAPPGRLRRDGSRRPARALAAPVLALELGPGSNEGIPQDLEAVQGLDGADRAPIGEGAISPTEIVVDTGRPGGAAAPDVQAAKERLASLLAR